MHKYYTKNLQKKQTASPGTFTRHFEVTKSHNCLKVCSIRLRCQAPLRLAKRNDTLSAGEPKKLNNILDTILFVWQLLSGFCLTHTMLCDGDIEEKGVFCCAFQNGSTERQSSESFYTSSCGTQSEWGSSTTVYAIKKSAWTMVKVPTDRQTVVERLLWIVTVAGCHSKQFLEWHPASYRVSVHSVCCNWTSSLMYCMFFILPVNLKIHLFILFYYLLS